MRCLLARTLATLTLAASLAAACVYADVPIETVGESAVLPPFKYSWFWSNDALTRRVTLNDFETNRTIASIDGTGMIAITTPIFLHQGAKEFYVPATYYSRGSRGDRTDVVTFYDTRTLTPNGEVILPPKRAQNSLPSANALVTDDDKFIVVFNMVPAQSISVVDIAKREFVAEIATPGCGLVYGAGAHRIMMLCGNGDLMFVTLNDDGSENTVERVAAQFDPIKDPVREYGIRIGDNWTFVSFNGYVYSIDVSQPKPVFSKPWSLLTNSERKDNWRIGGRQYLAMHGPSHRLYVLLHQGEVDTHKQGGTHVWVFDTVTHKKLDAVKLVSPGFTFTGEPLIFSDNWTWLYNFLSSFSFMEPHARPDLIAVTQDQHPTFLLSGEFTGMVAVYDALTMKFRHRVTTTNVINMTLLPTAWPEETGSQKPALPEKH
jgi:methylamine dehydrogenase heavy chain